MKDKLKGRKCFICKSKGCVGAIHLKAYCSIDCQAKLGLHLAAKSREEKGKEFKRETKRRKLAIRTRTEWFNILGILVNQYILYRDRSEACCTCKKNEHGIKYDAGHFRSRGACKELRFELTNIHKQCSVKCNVHGSGMRAAYNEFIIEKYGQEHYEWLTGPHPTLKVQFPHTDDIDKECVRYRKILKQAGIKPNR